MTIPKANTLKKPSWSDEPFKRLVYPEVLYDMVDGETNELGRDDLKEVGDDNKYRSKDQVPFILREILVEVL